MSWLEDVKEKMKRKNKILFTKDGECLNDLNLLIQKQNHQTMVLWAFEFAEETVQKLHRRYPNEGRPRNTLHLSREWAAGRVKMPIAKHAILQVHAFAKEIDEPRDVALCHAIGQACATVHTSSHAIGFAIYELTAMVLECGVEQCKEPIEQRIGEYFDRIYFLQSNAEKNEGIWADFLL